MNITHAKEENITGDLLENIFNRQKELMDKYHHIEERSGLLQTNLFPLDLNDTKSQARIKDFAWRITEEIGEALDAIHHQDKEDYYLHFVEELIDGLHFLTEITLSIGVTPNFLTNQKEKHLEWLYEQSSNSECSLEKRVSEFIENLGMMCNCLKNKPWKQTQMPTNKENFYYYLREVWKTYIKILSYSNLTPEEVTQIYLKKSQVNLFRQRSFY